MAIQFIGHRSYNFGDHQLTVMMLWLQDLVSTSNVIRDMSCSNPSTIQVPNSWEHPSKTPAPFWISHGSMSRTQPLLKQLYLRLVKVWNRLSIEPSTNSRIRTWRRIGKLETKREATIPVLRASVNVRPARNFRLESSSIAPRRIRRNGTWSRRRAPTKPSWNRRSMTWKMTLQMTSNSDVTPPMKTSWLTTTNRASMTGWHVLSRMTSWTLMTTLRQPWHRQVASCLLTTSLNPLTRLQCTIRRTQWRLNFPSTTPGTVFIPDRDAEMRSGEGLRDGASWFGTSSWPTGGLTYFPPVSFTRACWDMR